MGGDMVNDLGKASTAHAKWVSREIGRASLSPLSCVVERAWGGVSPRVLLASLLALMDRATRSRADQLTAAGVRAGLEDGCSHYSTLHSLNVRGMMRDSVLVIFNFDG